jgi:hypothetical protein
MTNCHIPNFRHSYQSPLPPLHPILTFSFSVRLCSYKSFGAALLQWHWVLSSTAVNSASPFWRWQFFLLSTLLPVCDKFCLGAQGASAVGCRLDLPLLARVVFSAIRRVLLASCSRPTRCSSDTPRLLRRRRFASHCSLFQFHFFLFGFHPVQHSHLDILGRLFIRQELLRLDCRWHLTSRSVQLFQCSAGDL